MFKLLQQVPNKNITTTNIFDLEYLQLILKRHRIILESNIQNNKTCMLHNLDKRFIIILSEDNNVITFTTLYSVTGFFSKITKSKQESIVFIDMLTICNYIISMYNECNPI